MTYGYKSRVLLVFGGRSGEHEISCATAAGMLRSIDREKWDVIPVGITKSGHWVAVPDDPSLLEFHDGRGQQVHEGFPPVVMGAGGHLLRIEDHGGKLDTVDLGVVDVVFPLLHGAYGEDGTIQGMLEMNDVRYVGCGVASSAICMDKHLTKTVLHHAGINVGHWELVTQRQWITDREESRSRIISLGFPLFVKPCRAGSSLGITRVDSADTLDSAIELAHQYDPRVIVEAAVNGREIECAVLASRSSRGYEEQARTGSLGEVLPPEGNFYDYEAKYIHTEDTGLKCPADVSPTDTQRITDIAIAAFEALECEGLARVDFFYLPESGSIILNEVNTMPGFTPYSLFPRMWENVGVGYPELIDQLIEEAMARPLGLR